MDIDINTLISNGLCAMAGGYTWSKRGRRQIAPWVSLNRKSDDEIHTTKF